MGKKALFLPIAIILLLVPLAFADIGPHSATNLKFYVNYENKPVDTAFDAHIIVCSLENKTECKIDASTKCKDGTCSFFYYRVERVPSRFQLMVDLYGTEYVSETINFSSKKYVVEYEVNITSGDKLSVKGIAVERDEWVVNYFLFISSISIALILTIIIELLVLVIFLKIWRIKKDRWKRLILTLVIMNVISVPLVWAIVLLLVQNLSPIAPLSGLIFDTVVAELFAILFEAVVIHKFNKKVINLKKAFVLSAAMNIASYFIGGIITLLIAIIGIV